MKKGFTLIELLAVIVILAIIAVIAVPIVLNIINDTKKSALESSAGFYIDAVEYSLAKRVLNGENINDGTYNIMESGNICMGTLENSICIGDILEIQIDSEKPKGDKIKIKDGKIVSYLIKFGDEIVKSENYIFTTEELQEMHIFKYYSTLNSAVNDVNNDTIGDNADANKEDAIAGVYTDNDQVYVVLLKNTTEGSRISPSVDMTINLGGYTLKSNDSVVVDIIGGKITIDGRIDGSTIEGTDNGSVAPKTIQARSGDITINGGTYIAKTDKSVSNGQTITIKSMANLKITNASFLALGDNTYAAAFQINSADLNMSNSDVTAKSSSSVAFGIVGYESSSMTISNSNIKAFSNLIYDDGNKKWTALSIGIDSSGTLTLDDCYVMGTHSGVQSLGDMRVNGGTYEGYGHGGIYFSGESTTNYVKTATIRECTMPDGYTNNISNGAGFYIGSGENITVRMDGCDIYGSIQPVVLRGSNGEQNNILYISNSSINLDYTKIGIRNDNRTLKVYIGAGCNFTDKNTQTPESVVLTNKVYVNE